MLIVKTSKFKVYFMKPECSSRKGVFYILSVISSFTAKQKLRIKKKTKNK